MFEAISRIIIDAETKNDDIMAVISPIKFNLGGRAIFIETANIHINEATGVVINRPLVNIMLRVLNFSYSRFVNINIKDDVNPWATIIVSLAYCPSFEFERLLMIIRPMCPTDE